MAGVEQDWLSRVQRHWWGRALQFVLNWLIGYPLIVIICALAFGPPVIRRRIDKLIMSPDAFQSKYWIMPE